jgi:hypothetical protein
VDKGRLTAKGYGENQLINKCWQRWLHRRRASTKQTKRIYYHGVIEELLLD